MAADATAINYPIFARPRFITPKDSDHMNGDGNAALAYYLRSPPPRADGQRLKLDGFMTDTDANFGIVPHKIYRKFARETQEIIGLGRSAIEDAIQNGDLPQPLPLTEHGTATGWLGATLIEVQRRRLALAEARRAAIVAGEAPSRRRAEPTTPLTPPVRRRRTR